MMGGKQDTIRNNELADGNVKSKDLTTGIR